jgi:hypothetical protein
MEESNRNKYKSLEKIDVEMGESRGEGIEMENEVQMVEELTPPLTHKEVHISKKGDLAPNKIPTHTVSGIPVILEEGS